MQITILIAALAAFSWLVVIGFIALAVMRARQGRKTSGSLTGIIVALVLAVVLNTGQWYLTRSVPAWYLFCPRIAAW